MPGKFSWIVTFVLMTSMGVIVEKSGSADEKRIIGWLENVYLPQYDFVLRAKIDTGAKSSSIHALEMKYVQREDRPADSRIRFRTTDINGRHRIVETNILRQVRIRRSGAETVTRPEIELEICLAGITKRIRVNLADRGEMNYRMILGRTALEGDYVIDVSKKYTSKKTCGAE